MLGWLYRTAATGAADLIAKVPPLERPFAALGPLVWQVPGAGRFYRSAAFRLAARLRARGAALRRINVSGHWLVLDVSEFTTTPLYFGGPAYEPATTACFIERLRPGALFVDIGANHGYFSMLAAAIVGLDGRVIAFEPNPAVFSQLEGHIRANGFESRVTAVPVALADAPAVDAPLYVSQLATNSGVSSLTPFEESLESGALSRTATVPVQVDTFDRWHAAHGAPAVDLMKIDVEGAEAKVIQGMTRALASRRIAAIICETTSDGDAHERLLRHGYTPRPLDHVGALTNILYSSPNR
jgi:FkbM family methyltransferase